MAGPRRRYRSVDAIAILTGAAQTTAERERAVLKANNGKHCDTHHEDAPSRQARQGPGILLSGLLAISACSENNSRIYEASNTGGDYVVLNCEELRVAQLSINQRLGTSSSYSNVGEPTILLQIQGETIAPIRESRDCPGGSTPVAVTPAQVVAEATDTELVEGRFLQVATFREVSNLDRMVAKLTDQGFAVQVRPITLAGNVYYRVVVGPLITILEVAKVDAAILKMGLADAFFLKP